MISRVDLNHDRLTAHRRTAEAGTARHWAANGTPGPGAGAGGARPAGGSGAGALQLEQSSSIRRDSSDSDGGGRTSAPHSRREEEA